MLNELIFRSYPNFSEQDYRNHVDTWIATEHTSQAETYYREEVLPRSAYRVRSHAPEEPIQLLFVPVGTQPYAPIMACLGTPAQTTVLLHSKRSEEFASKTQQAFVDETWRHFHKVLIDELDPEDIVRKVLAVYDVFGQPVNEEVTCDITGGTKLMTATLAGLAARNGWRQTYVNSTFVPHHKGSHSEEIITVPSIFDRLGGWNRTLAWRLAAVGQFGEAAHALNLAAEDSIASADDYRHIKRFELAHAYRQARLSEVSQGLETVADSFEFSLPNETIQLLQTGEKMGFLYGVAVCLADEDHLWAAAGVLGELGHPCHADQVEKTLETLFKEHEVDWQLTTWQPVHDFLGQSYRRKVATLGQG